MEYKDAMEAANRLSRISRGIITSFRTQEAPISSHYQGLVIEKGGKKYIVRIVNKFKRTLFGEKLISSYLDVEDYW